MVTDGGRAGANVRPAGPEEMTDTDHALALGVPAMAIDELYFDVGWPPLLGMFVTLERDAGH